MTKQHNKKSAPKSSPNRSNASSDAGFPEVYQRDNCAKCYKPISQDRILDCKARQFWPVCEECEKIIIPLYKEAMIKMAEMGKKF